MAHARETIAYAPLAEQHRHQAEPQRRGHGQVDAITALHQQRGVRIYHHGEQRQEEQRRLGVEAIGHEAGDERRTRGSCRCRSLGLRRSGRRWLGAQCLEPDVQQVGSGQPLQGIEQHDRLRNDQPDARQRIGHMKKDRGADTQGAENADAPAVSHALAHHHGEVRARARDGQQVNEGNGKKFHPVHGGSRRCLIDPGGEG